MLEKTNEMKAYKAVLAAGGLQTPASVIQARNMQNTAAALSTSLTQLVKTELSYPPEITDVIQGISGAVSTLDAWAATAASHADLLTENADLSTLIQLNIGWEVHCRAQGNAVTELPVSLAIGDADTPGAASNAVSALQVSELKEKMDDVNTTLASVPPAAAGTTAPAVSLSENQINDLKRAWTEFAAALSAKTAEIDALKEQTAAASASVNTALTSYNMAVTTALANACIGNVSTASAVSALVPADALTFLQEKQ